MTTEIKSILLIEDNSADAELVNRYLETSEADEFRLAHASSLKAAERIFQATPFDLIILDQQLPDSVEGETLNQCLKWSSGIPIIVLTGIGNEAEGAQRVRQGAQDYLVKGSFDAALFLRVLRYTVERTAMQKEVSLLKLREQKAIEIKALEAMDTSVLNGTPQKSIRSTAPVYYSDLVARYEGFLVLALEQRIFGQDRTTIAESVRQFTTELARHGAGPREIVEIHSMALERSIKGQAEAKVQAFLEEARLLLLETMGSMVQTYRNKFTMRQGSSSSVKADS
ncbi:MAG: response regulator [Proteobacteria bacterium]|nr:MAG: response regulator [Pseudomonadota bacterium]